MVVMGMLAALLKGAWITVAGLALLTGASVAARLASRRLLARSQLAERGAVDDLHVLGGEPRAELGEQPGIGPDAPRLT